MTLFVHIADQRDVASIRRSGLRLPRADRGPADPRRPRGIHALPVVPDFLVTHQWLRELRRFGLRIGVGVYFRVGDEETVWAGHYSDDKRGIAAAAAAAELREQGRLGYEVIVPRSVRATEIQSVRLLPQGLGWRYFPGAHDRMPCGCSYCQRGQRGARKLRRAYEAPWR